ncbi:MAG TPA: hypothetical protein VIH46_08885 [Candidatus Acidoferrales bacterium]
MLLLRYLLILSCFGLFAAVAGMVVYDIYLACELDRLLLRRANQPEDFGASRTRPIAPAESEETRLQPAARRVNPPGVQTRTMPVDGKFFLPHDASNPAIASETGGPLTRP